MPDDHDHSKNSKETLGECASDLHAWMDKPSNWARARGKDPELSQKLSAYLIELEPPKEKPNSFLGPFFEKRLNGDIRADINTDEK